MLLHKLRSVSTVAVGVHGGSKGCGDLSGHASSILLFPLSSCGKAVAKGISLGADLAGG